MDSAKHEEAAATAQAVEEAQNTTKTAPNFEELTSTASAQGQGLTGYEHLSIWETIKKFKMASLICFVAAISAAAEGYQIGLAGNIIANPGFAKQFGTQTNDAGEKVLASSVMSTWGSVAGVGQFVGQMAIPFVSNKFGRKAAMYTLWLILALSVTVECVSRNWKVWLVGKILGSMGVGCLQATIPVYVGEVAPIRARGTFLMCYSLWWVTGQFFAPVALQSMSTNDSTNWLTPVYTQWAQIGLMLIIFIVIPESPSWYASVNKTEQGKKSLGIIYGGIKDFDINRQYHLLEINIEHERAVTQTGEVAKWWEVFRGTDRLRTIISFWAPLSQQFIGLQVFFTYGTYFFQQAGIQDPFKVTCITSGVNIAASFVIIYLADITGRRWIVCSGTTLCMVCNVGVGILSVVPRSSTSDIFLVVFAVFWNIGLIANSASGYAYLSETSSLRLRTYTGGFAIGVIGPLGIVLSVLVPYMINANQWNWGLKTCWFFTGIGMPFVVAMWFLMPETAGRSTAELDELFERKIKPWRFHKTETLTQKIIEMKEVAARARQPLAAAAAAGQGRGTA
ncbi:hypothetical protein BHE90_014669 [Fusarium euwallaceae]|uniref:Major facilitator superfamily (MFS) profile domain-containing protein n=2 Tax=Fusarium solani species complex TaxID=232080 RepID=A0A430L5B4_9HYPO|nr:hypothetical protein CDV31_005319 [Fusarium ambrosium]RTE70926.1 hypothetical protein BHE90_014669 [Fusarium euwallaceae]